MEGTGEVAMGESSVSGGDVRDVSAWTSASTSRSSSLGGEGAAAASAEVGAPSIAAAAEDSASATTASAEGAASSSFSTLAGSSAATGAGAGAAGSSSSTGATGEANGSGRMSVYIGAVRGPNVSLTWPRRQHRMEGRQHIRPGERAQRRQLEERDARHPAHGRPSSRRRCPRRARPRWSCPSLRPGAR